MRGKYFVVGAVAAASLLLFSSAQAETYSVGQSKECKTLKSCVAKVPAGSTILLPIGVAPQKGKINVKKTGLKIIAGPAEGVTLNGGFKLTSKSNNLFISGINFSNKAPIVAKGADNVTIVNSTFSNANTAIFMDTCRYWTIGDPDDNETGNTFAGINFAVYGEGSDNITVAHNSITNPIQGITNWEGNFWQVTNNVVKNGLRFVNGGGIGILVASSDSAADNNTVSKNTISGEFEYVGKKGASQYAGAGIALVGNGVKKNTKPVVTDNSILENSIAIVSQAVGTSFSAYGIMLNEILPKKATDAVQGWIKNNTIADNNLTGSTKPYGEKPSGIDGNNVVTTDAGALFDTESSADGVLRPF